MKIRSISAIVLLSAICAVGRSAVTVEELRCGQGKDPLGVDVPGPELSWRIASDQRGAHVTAWQILAASSAQLLAKDQGDLWDSGRVSAERVNRVAYAGRPLASSARCHWKVRVWDYSGERSEWSRPAEWTMGLLNESDWQAGWITAPDPELQSVLLRREFKVRPGLKRALAHVCGLGHYELTLNGRKSGEDLLSPGWTKYDKTCLYDTHDLTRMVQPGSNVAGLVLGNGMYRVPGGRYTKFTGSFGPLKAIMQLRLEYDDGSVEFIGTDGQWKVNPGPFTFTCVYGGEDFDARKGPVGWDKPDFDAKNWLPALTTNGPGGRLRGFSSSAPPLRAIETMAPVSRNPLKPGVEVFDLGQNASFMPRIRVRGPAGSALRITPAELLGPDGSVDRISVGKKDSFWKYTLAGSGDETWFPKFHYQGCRYLQVESIPAAPGGELPVIGKLEGVVVHTAAEPAGDFRCSNDLFNRIHTLVRWAQRSNVVSVITDCPHRERLGWLEQYHLNGPSLRYEFNLDRLFAKTMLDMRDSQLATGMVPSIAPEYTVFGKNPQDDANPFRNSPEWGSAIVLVPWQQYEFTGDTTLLRLHYEDMKRYLRYLEAKAVDHIVDFGLGDWYDIGPKPPGQAQLTPKSLTATAFYFYDTWVLAQAAWLLGNEAEARQFAGKAEEIRAAFNAKFYDPAKASYATGSQCANAIPLVMNLCAEENRKALLDTLVADVRSRGNAITAGDVGYRYLLRALADGGRSDVVFDMNNQSDKPGYGFQLARGATSLTEAWDARRSSSQNHFMLGQIIEWFYHDLAGIQGDPSSLGFGKVIIKPAPVGDLTWASAHYDSPNGRIASGWKRSGGSLSLDVTIPANTSATVFVPASAPGKVTESGAPADGATGVWFLRAEGGAAVFAVSSGTYHFQSTFR
ncbi:MAG: hypothetical protein RLZZ214_4266 [Verrucomicrobiota bacterium]|jgi:hypothetical protein